MPRKPPQPGPRGNRSDLPAPGSAAQPVRVASGRPYGERGRTTAALSALPLPDASTDDLPSAAAAGASGQRGGGDGGGAVPTDPLAEFVAAAQGAQAPGQGLLSAPSSRPGEPVTAGLPIGPGGGAEAMPPSLATSGPDPALVLWTKMLPALGVLASQPGSSPQIRQYYRRLRSQVPPDYLAQHGQ
jgi:hypothetical protein